MRGIGRGVREFNDAKEHVKSEIEAGMKDKDVEKKQEVLTNSSTPAPEVTAAPTPVSATPTTQNS